MNPPFPSKLQVWSGAILGGIVNAVMTAQNIGYASFRCWSRNTYVLQGGDGRDGAITFAGGHWYPDAPLVGVFFDVHGRKFIDDAELLEHCFSGCPEYQRSLANGGALQYLQFEGPGSVRATAAFWDEGEQICASDDWNTQLMNGVDLISEELIEDHDAALVAFTNSDGLSEEQVKFIRRIFRQKLAKPADCHELSRYDLSWLQSTFEDPKIRYEQLDLLAFNGSDVNGNPQHTKWWESIDSAAEAKKAINACREQLTELGIRLTE